MKRDIVYATKYIALSLYAFAYREAMNSIKAYVAISEGY